MYIDSTTTLTVETVHADPEEHAVTVEFANGQMADVARSAHESANDLHFGQEASFTFDRNGDITAIET